MSEEHKEVAAIPPSADDAPERLSREDMLDQLQVMARQIAGDAPPAWREASAAAAELAAIAARGTGPIAHTLADVTDDASLRLAERLDAYAARVRETDVTEAVPGDVDDVPAESAAPADTDSPT